MGVGRYACFADFRVASHGPSGNGCDGCGRNGVFPGFPVLSVWDGRKCKTIDLAVVPRFCGMATLERANSSWRPTTMLKLDHDASRPNASAVIWPL